MASESIIQNPTPPAAIKIAAIQKGAYSPQVRLADGRSMSLADYCEKYIVNDTPGAVADFWVLENFYGTSLAQTPASEGWMSAAGAVYYRGLFVPSLQDLGIDPNKYKVEVSAAAVVRDALGTADPVDIRLLSVPANTEISGAGATLVVSGEAKEEIVQGDWVEVPTNAQYFVDIRKRNVGGIQTVQARRQLLFMRLVRR